MEREAIFMKIRNNDPLLLKLITAQMLIDSSKEKLRLYWEKQIDLTSKIAEDEYSFLAMSAYFEENMAELEIAAEESIVSAEEAEEIVYSIDEEDSNYGRDK